MSYQLYLWHWPAILGCRQLATLFLPARKASGGAIAAAVAALALVVGVGAPLFSYQ